MLSLERELTLPKFSLGWELEAVHRAENKITGIECGHDSSVNGESLEYRIKKENVFDPSKSLESLRALTVSPGLQVDPSCGFHVHIGLGRRSRRLHDWAKWFVQLAREVETEAFEAVPSSRRASDYCRSWKANPQAIGTHQYNASKGANENRYQWVNPVEIFRPGGIRTIEIRLMGNCKRYTHLLSWIACCRLMAQSSWALMFDPTRLESEKQTVRSAFALVRDTFMTAGVPKKKVAKNAVYLAEKAGLIYPFGHPLQLIHKVESDIHFRESDRERRSWEAQFTAMKREYDRALRAPLSERINGIASGDTVRCISPDADEGLAVGHYYRVLKVNTVSRTPYAVCVAREGNSFNVSFECLEVVERIGIPCAV